MSQNKITSVNATEFAAAVVANSEEHDISKLLDIYVESLNQAASFNQKHNQKQNGPTMPVDEKIKLIKQLGL